MRNLKTFNEFLSESRDLGQFDDKNYTGASVINLGNVAVTTSGKTKYGWSIYDDPKMAVFLVADNLLYAAEGTFEIGESVALFNNDTKRRVKFTGGVIKDLSKCVKKDVIEMLQRNEYDYTLVKRKPFQKAEPKKYWRKLGSTYSVKGTHNGRP